MCFSTARDPRAMKDYLVSTLGFREDNVHVMLNLGREQMDLLFGNPNGSNQVMTFVRQHRKEVRGDVFVYYSGHGVPNPCAAREEEKRAYLLPVDVAPDAVPVRMCRSRTCRTRLKTCATSCRATATWS